MLRRVLFNFIRFLFYALTRLEIIGKENVPPEGSPCLVAVNHISRLDAPLVFVLLGREDVTGLISTKYQKNPFFRWVIEKGDAIWINREELDIDALRAARAYLHKGGALGIAPEGMRSPEAQMIPAKTGVAYLAEKGGAPILPVAVTGTEKAVSALFRLRRARVTVQFGKPFQLPPLDRRDRTASLQQNTARIMIAIARMLPPAYQGVYAGEVERENHA